VLTRLRRIDGFTPEPIMALEARSPASIRFACKNSVVATHDQRTVKSFKGDFQCSSIDARFELVGSARPGSQQTTAAAGAGANTQAWAGAQPLAAAEAWARGLQRRTC